MLAVRLLLFVLSAALLGPIADAAENLRIVYREVNFVFDTCDLMLTQPGKNKTKPRTEILASTNIDACENPDFITVPAAGLICWRPFNSNIHCLNSFTKERKQILLPDGIRTANYSLDMVSDLFGNNIYLLQRFNKSIIQTKNVWAVSIQTGASKLLLRAKSIDKYSVDDYNGHVFTLDSSKLRLKVYVCDHLSCDNTYTASIPSTASFMCTNPLTQELFVDHDMRINAGTYPRKVTRYFYRNGVLGHPMDVIRYYASGERWYNHFAVHRGNFFIVGEYPKVRGNGENLSVIKLNPAGTSVISSKALLQVAPDVFAVFKNRTEGKENPCKSLRCSHLCLFGDSGHYACSCPAGMLLIDQHTCKSKAILSHWIKTTLVHYQMEADSFQYDNTFHTCAFLIEHASQEFCSAQIIRDFALIELIVSWTQMNIAIELDPFGVGYCMKENDCIQFCNLQGICGSFSCINPGAGVEVGSFDVDFVNGVVTYKRQRLGSQSEVCVRFLNIKGSLQSRESCLEVGSIYGLTVDTQSAQIVFGTDGSALYFADYKNFERHKVTVQLLSGFQYYLLSLGLIYFHQDHVLGVLELDSINKQDFVDTNQTDPHFVAQLFVLPPKAVNDFKRHPCNIPSPPCEYLCVPTSKKTYRCECPEYTQSTEGSCIRIPVLIAHRKGESVDLVSTDLASMVGNISLTNATFSVPAGSPILSIRHTIAGTKFCWKQTGQAVVKCTTEAAPSSFYYAHSIHWGSTSLTYDSEDGDRILYDDGEFGHFWLQFKDLKLKFAEFQPPNGHLIWKVDMTRLIVFWTGISPSFCHKILHDTDSKPSCSDALARYNIFDFSLDQEAQDIFFVTESNDVKGAMIIQLSYEEACLTNGQSFEQLHPLYRLESTRDLVFGTFQFSNRRLYWIENSATAPVLVVFDTSSFKLDRICLSFITAGQLLYFSVQKPLSRREINPCTNATCPHFCFPSSQLDKKVSRTEYKCVCSSDYIQETGTAKCLSPSPTASHQPINAITGSIIAMVSILAPVVVAIATCLFMKRKKDEELARLIKIIREGNAEVASNTGNGANRSEYLPLTCIIPPTDLVVDHTAVLGAGAFGNVVRGLLDGAPVAVKTLKPSWDLNQLSEFAREVKLMHYIGHHPNIVGFLGAEISNIKKGTFYAVLELSNNGSLLQYIRELSSSSDAVQYANTFTEISPKGKQASLKPLLIDWAHQIASGMQYLCLKEVVHGDLAARNVLVFQEKTLKISDFGLSRRMYQSGMYQKKSEALLPFRWMAIECLETMEFSSKSDVWAYGVTLWEICSLGKVPFSEHNWISLVSSLQQGVVLPQPDLASAQLYEQVMKPCWSLNKDQRPDFGNILDIISLIKSEHQNLADQSTDAVDETDSPGMDDRLATTATAQIHYMNLPSSETC